MKVLAALEGARVVGVLRADTPDAALTAARAAVRGGLKALEVTFTVPGAADVLRTLSAELGPEVALGAGTVLTAELAEQAADAGATFLVSPHLGEDVLEAAQALSLPYLPGVLTPTEVARALRLGVEAVKLFPAGALGGAGYLRDLRGPFPGLRVMATGGVEPGQVAAYLGAGALAVGLGSQLFPAAAVRAGDAEAVERSVRAALAGAGVRA